MMAANQGSDPMRGTINSDVETMMTPIAPPIQIHQGRVEGGTTNRGGNPPPIVNVRISKIAVPLEKEISEACSGCATLLPNDPLTLGCVPSKQPASNPTTMAASKNDVEWFKGLRTRPNLRYQTRCASFSNRSELLPRCRGVADCESTGCEPTGCEPTGQGPRGHGV